VCLNRRLAANVYCGVVPLTVDPQGTMELDGSGATIDWLVKMRRLPATRMLDYVITHGTVHETDMRHIGALLARFYTQAPPVAITPAAYRRCLAESVHATCGELVQPVYALPVALVESVHTAQGEFLQRFPELFDRRVDAGRIIEAHGDLRPEHICLEFNRDLRILETVSELAFLALECERLGAPSVGDLILETYSEATGDRPPERLLRFYKSYHASMRAKIAVWHLKEPNGQDAAKWKVAPLAPLCGRSESSSFPLPT
jgi:aminoglycoside phosphotransferase family enzyme